MKKYFTITALFALLAFVPGCPTGSGGGSGDEPPPSSGTTYIRFVNHNDVAVSLYSDNSRLSKLLDLAPSATSNVMETSPNDFAVFYPTYHIIIDDLEFPYEAGGLSVRIDSGKTTDAAIPLLAEFDSDEMAKPLSSAVHLKVQNAGSSSLVLQRGSYEEIPQGMLSPLVNGGETAIYTVNTGPVSNYAFLKNSTAPVAFPAGLTDFSAGHLYSLKFDGTSLALLADKSITIAQVLKILPPENLRAKNLANGHISLVWDQVGTESAYGIYRSESSAGPYTGIGTVNTTSYTDTAVTIGTTYYYRLSSKKGNIESEKSISVVSARSEVISLTPPAGLNVYGRTAESVSLSWNPVAEATGYTVYKGSAPDAVNGYVAAVSSTSYTVTGLQPDTSYYFAVSSVNSSGESLPSGAVQGTTASSGPSGGGDGTIPLPPSKPAGLVVSNSTPGSVSLSWNSVANAASYEVYRGNSKDGVAPKIGTTGGTSYADYTAGAGASYYYSVKAVNASGASPASDRAFAFAASHYTLPGYGSSNTMSLPAGQTQYYRLPVISGQTYTITWEDGNSANANYYIRCSAWQNNGTEIFGNANDGYSSPKAFTASMAGYITVEVKNISGSTGYNYKIYYH
jgi:fibronectin type 3 domain-containing protein